MDLQKHLLRSMLWLLGLAAAAGVLAVFLSTQIMGRVAGTALIGAIALAASMPLSRWLDDPKKRQSGLIGLGGILLSFVVSLTAVWIDVLSTSWQVAARLGLTGALLAVSACTIAGIHALRTTAAGRLAAPIGYCGLTLTTACFVSALWIKSDELGLTGLYFLASLACCSFSLVGLGLENRQWRWIGVLASLAAFALAMVGTWFVDSRDPSVYILLITTAGAIAYAIVMLRLPLGDARFWCLFAAIGSTSSLAGSVSALSFITTGFDQAGPDLLTRVTGAMAILSACSTLAALIIYRLNRRPGNLAESAITVSALQIVCPCCGKKDTVPVGKSACTKCGLILSIKVREPSCAKCGYSMLSMGSAPCPECGSTARA